MRGEQLSDAIIYEKLNVLKKDFFGYIERNTEKVDLNLPVFYGYVISALDSSFPDISDESHDEFIDSITFKVLDASKNAGESDYIRKVMVNALRLKKQKNADRGIDIVVGLRLLKLGDVAGTLEYVKKYSDQDAKLGTVVAYCYYALSLREFKESKDQGSKEQAANQRPGEMELLARETMLNLARSQPPVNQLKQLELEDPAFLEKIFWQMIFLGLEWFPSERWFIEIGLKNAALTNHAAMRKRLLDIGSERFYTDKTVLREMYYFKLENRDAGGAAGVVNQFIKQYPDDLEPIFLGLKLSILTTKRITFHSFRKLARAKGMPANTLELFDIAFDLLTLEKKDAFARIMDFEKESPKLRYYATTLRYIARDFFSPDDMRKKRAKKTLLDSIEQYCQEELKK